MFDCRNTPISCIHDCSQYTICFVIQSCFSLQRNEVCNHISQSLYDSWQNNCGDIPEICKTECTDYNDCFLCDQICETSCSFSSDDECDDGGYGSDYSVCAPGSDCDDCGYRLSSNCSFIAYGIPPLTPRIMTLSPPSSPEISPPSLPPIYISNPFPSQPPSFSPQYPSPQYPSPQYPASKRDDKIDQTPNSSVGVIVIFGILLLFVLSLGYQHYKKKQTITDAPMLSSTITTSSYVPPT